MNPAVYELIRSSPVDSGTNSIYTHVSFYGPKQNWYIKSNEYEKFWSKYCQLTYEKKEHDEFCLGEKSQDTMPILVKLTLKFQNDERADLYGQDFILALVYTYQQAMLELLQLSNSGTNSDGKELLCCILESDGEYLDDNFIPGSRQYFLA